MPTLTFNRTNIVIIKNGIILNIIHNILNLRVKNGIILNIIHNILNLRDTEVVIYIILVLVKGIDGPNHYLNIR